MPYTIKNFFHFVKIFKESSPIDICKMSLKQIYTALLDHNLIRGLDKKLIPLHMEVKLPWNSWDTTWKCIRLKGLCGLAASTTYCSILNILSTWERLAKVNQASSSSCPHCPSKVEDVWHTISQCQSKDAANFLLAVLQQIQPSLCISEMLYLV